MKSLSLLVLLAFVATLKAEPWKRHTIDSTSRGADGIRLADVNGDGLLDIATGWEEGGAIRVYIHPGPARSKQPWPAVTVGQVKSPEDAVLADLDGNGRMDVVSSCEGATRAMYVHWAPDDAAEYLNASAWRTEAVPCTVGTTRWMFALPRQIDGRHGTDLFVGSKSPGALVGWLQAPPDAHDLATWRLHRLYQAGWIMSLIPIDMDADGDCDVIASDRYGDRSGVLWLEHPGIDAPAEPWVEHRVGLRGQQVMFMDVCDLDEDGQIDVAAAVKPRKIALLRQNDGDANSWSEQTIEFPADRFGTSKSVRVTDLNLDGRWDLVVTCEGADGDRSGVFWISSREPAPVPVSHRPGDDTTGKAAGEGTSERGPGRGDRFPTVGETTGADRAWAVHDISGPEGTKYDLIQLQDLDQDGDLDVLTCEERVNLGVIWYENPAR